MIDGAGQARPWSIVFFGSANFSVPALKALAGGPDDLVLTVAPPPARCGRGLTVSECSPAAVSRELGRPVLEAKSLRRPEIIEAIGAVQPDLLVVAAFGGFLPEALLDLCPHPPLNIHPSLLPRHRGPAPVNWSIIQGDKQIGVSIIFLEKEMDAGPILRQRVYDYHSPAGAGEWEARLAAEGAEDLLAVIADLKAGRARPVPQSAALATVNPLLRKADGRVDFQRPAAELANLINGVDPWPGAQTTLGGKSLKLFRALARPQEDAIGYAPGEVVGPDPEHGLLLATGRGLLAIGELQPEG
ncbi:methionyl-tRNA formyltransferase, partial [Deltaproteobacteria bacterium OttesenSCG-928-M10]|nr:methionyl-tRNA formyltransferase [Deltaproteobacteria bacterium OttesenSCG-928-M10]